MNFQDNPMFQLAERYADELTAQFRTLNFFVNHAGEIGRVHETYLKEIISRFLPSKLAIGTGFIAHEDWISSQQDIIVYRALDLPTLFKAGECVVIDSESFIGAIEVKTKLTDKTAFLEAYNKLTKLSEDFNHSSCFTALFIWEGLSLESLLEAIWGYLEESPPKYWNCLPNVIYIRSKYVLLLNEAGDRNEHSFRLLHISEERTLSEGKITEGLALITLISELWNKKLQEYAKRPWWLVNWWKILPDIEEKIYRPQ